jgi:hypothetical protein
MHTIFNIAPPKYKKAQHWIMYTIFIVVTKNKKRRKRQHLDNVHNIHCCNPKKKKKNIGQCTIRYKGAEGGD